MSEPSPVSEPLRRALLFGSIATIVVLAVTSKVRDARAGPSAIEAAPPITCDVETRLLEPAAGSGVRRRFVRSAGVVAVARSPGGTWCFRQDDAAPDRFDAVQVDVETGVARRHSRGELEARGLAATWDGLVQLGVEPDLLGRLESDGRTTVAFGLVFDHRVARAADSALALREVWWNEEWKLPLRVVRRVERNDTAKVSSQEVVQEVVAFERRAAAAEVAASAASFRGFDLGDDVDSIEHHGETAAASAGAVNIR